MRRLVGLLAAGCFASTAVAQPAATPAQAPVTSGGLAAPTTRPAKEPLPHNLPQRRIIRGCDADEPCDALLDDLQVFERQAFAGDGRVLWATPLAAPPPGGISKPSQLNPEWAWMDALVMPDLPVQWDERVIRYLLHYKTDEGGRRLLRTWLRSQGRYAAMILETLRKAHLPEDLLYVAMVESNYQVRAVSHAGAAGLWQFMPGAGRIYGLKIDRWVDERNDPVRATEAAAEYFRDLYQRFGSWPLAISAYNAGYGAMLRAIARYNSNDYWQLLRYENSLPWETQLYFPKAAALAIIGKNREVFGVADVEPLPAEAWDEITPRPSTSLGAIAKAAGCSLDALKQLNPHLKQGRTPPDREGFVVRIPKGTSGRYAAQRDRVIDPDKYKLYSVPVGERMEDVAMIFGTSVSALRRLNDIDNDAEIAGGAAIYVPIVSAQAEAAGREAAKVALHSSGLDSRPGEPLIVAVPDKDADQPGKRRVFYRTVTGDQWDLIAAALGISEADLAAANGMAADAKLHPRMVLQAWVEPSFDPKGHISLLDDSLIVLVTRGSPEHMDVLEQRTGRERVEYVAQKRETFAEIGRRYGLDARDLARINRKPSTTTVEAGETIIVYRVVDKTRSDRAADQWRAMPKAKPKKPQPASQKAKGKGTQVATKASKQAKADTKPDAKPAPAAKPAVKPTAQPAAKPAAAAPKMTPRPVAAKSDAPVSMPD